MNCQKLIARTILWIVKQHKSRKGGAVEGIDMIKRFGMCLQMLKSYSFVNFVLLRFDLEELRNVRFLGISALGIDHETHCAVAASLAWLGSFTVGGNRDEWMDSRVAILGGSGLRVARADIKAVRGLRVTVIGPMRKSREALGFCLLVERNSDLQEPVRGESRANRC